MTTHETQLAGDLLDHLADRFADEQRRDWKFPESWTHEQRLQFLIEFNHWNGAQDEAPNVCLHHHAVAGFLAHKLRTQ